MYFFSNLRTKTLKMAANSLILVIDVFNVHATTELCHVTGCHVINLPAIIRYKELVVLNVKIVTTTVNLWRTMEKYKVC